MENPAIGFRPFSVIEIQSSGRIQIRPRLLCRRGKLSESGRMAQGHKRAAPADGSAGRSGSTTAPPAVRRRLTVGNVNSLASHDTAIDAVAGPSDLQATAASGDAALEQLSSRIAEAAGRGASEVTLSLHDARDLRDALASTVTKCTFCNSWRSRRRLADSLPPPGPLQSTRLRPQEATFLPSCRPSSALNLDARLLDLASYPPTSRSSSRTSPRRCHRSSSSRTTFSASS